MRAYISGPISGASELPLHIKRNRFNTMAKWLPEQPGFTSAVSPLETGNANCPGDCNPDGHVGQEGTVEHSWECYMIHDIADLLTCNAIVMLPRWEASPGALIELNLAIALKYKVFFARAVPDWEIIEKHFSGPIQTIGHGDKVFVNLNDRHPEDSRRLAASMLWDVVDVMLDNTMVNHHSKEAHMRLTVFTEGKFQ